MPFAAEIEGHINRYVPRAPFTIYVDGATEPLSRPYRADFLVSGAKRDRFVSCQLLEFSGLDGQPAAAGWILHHNYLGAIRATPTIHGLRARVGDMQIGDQQIFINAFPESRFNSWVVGELHVLDRRILPNGRRDDFEHNSTYGALSNQLVPVCRELARRCRASSAARSRFLRFDTSERQVKELLRGVRSGLTGGRSPRSLLREVDQVLRQMAGTAQSALFTDLVTTGLQRRLKRLVALRKRVSETNYQFKAEVLVPPAKRRTYDEIVRLVIASAPTKQVAEAMVKRIGRLISQKARR